jgi:hypothetical protein
MEFVYKQLSNDDFSDFVTMFVAQGQLHLVFKAFEGISLKNKLNQETVVLKERLQLAKNIHEKIVLMNMPLFFLYRVLDLDHIMVNQSLNIDFSYEAVDITNYREYSFLMIQQQMMKMMTELFSDEWSKKRFQPLMNYMKSLEKSEFINPIELYSRFSKVCDLIESGSEEASGEPMNWAFRLWYRIRRLFKPIRRILAILLWVVALLYMIIVINDSMQPSEDQRMYKYIGTVDIISE